MPPQPKVSIVLANWNGARFLHATIESVVRQSHEDWEWIVVDTASEDHSRAIIEAWATQDHRIKPVYVPGRLLCPSAINLGLGQAQGAFIARIESDDLWRSDRLSQQLAFLSDPGRQRIGVCGSAATAIDASGRELYLKRFPPHDTDCLRAIWYRNPFCHSSVLIRRAVFEDCGLYDDRYYLVEDLELWYRVARKWGLANLPAPLVSYRIWTGGLTTRKLRLLAWRSHAVRARAVREFGFTRPWRAYLYSIATLTAMLLPPRLARAAFEKGLQICARRAVNSANLDNAPYLDGPQAVNPLRPL